MDRRATRIEIKATDITRCLRVAQENRKNRERGKKVGEEDS